MFLSSLAPDTPWSRPASLQEWQTELEALEKPGKPLEMDKTPGLAAFCNGMGLSLGYLLGIGVGLFHGTLVPALCVAPILLLIIALCFFGAFSVRQEARRILAKPENHRRLLLAKVPKDCFRNRLGMVPAAYLEYLALKKSAVPVLAGDIVDICHRHHVSLLEPDGEWGWALVMAFMLALLVAVFVGSLSSL